MGSLEHPKALPPEPFNIAHQTISLCLLQSSGKLWCPLRVIITQQYIGSNFFPGFMDSRIGQVDSIQNIFIPLPYVMISLPSGKAKKKDII